MPLETAAGCVMLGSFAEEAVGDDDTYDGATHNELLGVICAWDRVKARQRDPGRVRRQDQPDRPRH
jgi:hypothetical protein